MIADVTLNVTSSAESQDGQLPLPLPNGPTTSLSGPAAALASHLVRPDLAKVQKMSAICGPLSIPSSASASLQRSLESRLRALTDGYGSPLYGLTWKQWDMPLGLSICALRASVRRTSGSDCTGWPTPMTNDSPYSYGPGRRKILKLGGVAQLAGWPTPQVSDTKQAYGSQENAFRRWERNPFPSLAVYAKALGTIPNGSTAATESTGQLNPELARWLMGYPAGWSSYAVMGTRSIRTKRRPS
jgi:hypothetical protein